MLPSYIWHKIISFFPEIDYSIVIEEDSLIKIFKKNTESKCIHFIINDDYIYIESLNRCDNISGTKILNNIYKLAQQLGNIKYIQLEDESYILKCNKKISLATIKILTTGKSWYNKLEYKSENYENELELNQQIIEKKYIDFKKEILLLSNKSFKQKYLQQINEKQYVLTKLKLELKEKEKEVLMYLQQKNKKLLLIRKQEELKQIKDEIQQIEKEIETLETGEELAIIEENKKMTVLIEDCNIENDKILFPDIDVNINVKDYFTSILSKINDNIKTNGCENETIIEQCNWLSKFIYIIQTYDILQYNKLLTNIVTLEETTDSSTAAIKNKYIKYKNKYLNLKNQLG